MPQAEGLCHDWSVEKCRLEVSKSVESPRLGAEGAAAAAGGLRVGVVELKPGALKCFDVVHLGAIQIQHARLVDEHVQIAKMVGLVEHPRGVFEGHRVAESGATSAHNG